MGRCFDMAHQVHEQGDGKRAKELSEEGHRHQREMEKYNREASEWIFRGERSSLVFRRTLTLERRK
jgi:hypothetical protein